MDTSQVPDWYPETTQLIRHMDGILRNLELEFLDFMERQQPDWRVRGELERLVEALHGTAGALALVEMETRNAVREVGRAGAASRPATPPLRAASG
jgi:hypothetical protein